MKPQGLSGVNSSNSSIVSAFSFGVGAAVGIGYACWLD